MPFSGPKAFPYIVQDRLVGAALALTFDATLGNVLSLAFPAGDWEVSAEAHFTAGATTQVGNLQAHLATANNAANFTLGMLSTCQYGNTVLGNNVFITHRIGPTRLLLAAAATYYLNAAAVFNNGGSVTVHGRLRARRLA